MRRTIGTTSSTRPRTTVRPSTTSHTRQSTRPSVVSTPGKPLSSFVSSLNSRKTVSYTPRDREKLTLHTPTRIKRTAASPSSSTSHGKPVSTFIFSLNGQVDETTNDNDYRGKGNNVPSRSRTPDRSDHQLTASSTTKRTKSLTPSTSTSHGKPVSTFIFSLNGQVDEPDLASETLGHDSRSYRHSTSTDRGASRTMPRKDIPKPLPRLRSLPYKPIDPRKDQLNEDGMHPSWLIRRRNAAAQRALCTRRVKRLHIRFVDDGHDEQSD